MADENKITWCLSDPTMGLLERAGLAALYMALQAATDRGKDLSPLSWETGDLAPDSVTLRWDGVPKPGFEKLMEWAWQVHEGILFLPAIHDERDRVAFQYRVPSHNGIMRTFLQHVNTQPKLESVTRLVQIDEDKTVAVSFEPPSVRVNDLDREKNPKTKRLYKKKIGSDRVRPHEDLEKLFDRAGKFAGKDISLSNWVYPGIAGRYANEGSWGGPATTALLLMLAPTVCLYLRLQGKGGNWVLVIPDVRSLEDFGATRRRIHLNSDFTDVASLGDAALFFLAEYATRNPRKTLEAGCRVVAMGYVGYYQGQSIRKSVLDIPPEMLPVKRYRLLHREMPNIYVALKADSADAGTKPKSTSRRKKSTKIPKRDGSTPTPTGFMKLPAARGRIADNLAGGRPWYADLTVPLIWDQDEIERQRKRTPGTSIERLWFKAICFQRSKLMKLIAEDDMWDSEAERVFVQAFWETLDSLYAQEAAATERGGSRTASERFEDMNDEIRRRLTQAKTRTLLRAVLADLFARAGRQKSIGAHPAAVWRLIDHPNHWQKGHDLALLALASHRKREDRKLIATEKGA
jgi:CRISPR-associated protein Cas8a1/Csx13